MTLRTLSVVAAVLAVVTAAPAAAEENEVELWFNPSVSAGLGARTGVELESWQRFRQGGDTHGYRLWLKHGVSDRITLYGGVERRLEGASRETRFLQQASYPLGPLKARTRFEQRDLKGAARTALRLRQRIGVSFPLSSDEGGWAAIANAEGFFTLRGTSRTAQTGLTGLRTIVGVEKSWERVGMTLGYARQQTFRDNRPDTVAHAPLIGIDISL